MHMSNYMLSSSSIMNVFSVFQLFHYVYISVYSFEWLHIYKYFTFKEILPIMHTLIHENVYKYYYIHICVCTY